MKLKLFLFSLFATQSIFAAITNVYVVDQSTATQIVLHYTAPTNDPCTLKVSTSQSLSPLAYDVDPAHFTNANYDNRGYGALSYGRERIFVVGYRAAQLDLNGVWISRAIEASTNNFFQITCSATGDVYNGSAETSTIPYGSLYQTPPGDNFPTIPTTVRNFSPHIIDPYTGLGFVSQLALTTDTRNGQYVTASSSLTWSNPDGVSWTNPTYITSGTAPGAQSVAGHSGQSSMLLGNYQLPNRTGYGWSNGSYMPYNNGAGGSGLGTLIYLQVIVTATVNAGGTAPSGTDAQIQLCAGMNSTTSPCDAGSAIYTSTLTPTSTPYTYGTGADGDMMRAVFGVGIPSWVAQGLNGVNLGIWRVSAGTGTVNITSVVLKWDAGAQQVGDDGGGYFLSASNLIQNGPDGEPGYVFSRPPMQYFIDQFSGRATFVGSTNWQTGLCNPPANTGYMKNDPVHWMCTSFGNLYKITQVAASGNQWQAHPSGGQYTVGNAMRTNFCGTPPCINVQTLTTNFPGLIYDFTSAPLSKSPVVFDQANFVYDIYTGIEQGSGHMVGSYKLGFSNAPSQFGFLYWTYVFDPAATSNASGGSSSLSGPNYGCLGGGVPGCIIAAVPVWAVDGAQWGTWKENDMPGGGFVVLQTYFAQGSQYALQVDAAGATNGDGSQTQLSSTETTPCPAPWASSYCTQVTVSSIYPTSVGTLNYNPNTPVTVNSFVDLTAGTGQGSPTEKMRIIRITPSATSGKSILLLKRSSNQWSQQSSGSLPLLYLTPAMNQSMETNPSPGGIAYWNYAKFPYGVDPSGNRQALPPEASQDGTHAYYTNGVKMMGGAADGETRIPNNGISGYAVTAATNDQIAAVIAPQFAQSVTNEYAGFNADNNVCCGAEQSHMSGDWKSPNGYAHGFTGHPYQGFFNVVPANVCTFISGTLCSFPVGYPPPGFEVPYSKVTPRFGWQWHTALKDISSPATGNVLTDQAVDLNKFCVAAKVNECRTGSAIGQVYANVQNIGVLYDSSTPQNGTNDDSPSLILRQVMQVFSGIQETRFPTVCTVCNTRLLTRAQHMNIQSVFDSAQSTPGGEFVIMNLPLAGDGSAQNAWMVARLPADTVDNVDRSVFWQRKITLPPVAGAASAYILGGYAEFGNPFAGQFFASERQENSVFTTGTTVTTGNSSSTTANANPFFYQQTETWTSTSCSTGCTITLNMIPQRVMYYQAYYLNGSGALIYTSPTQIAVSP